MSKNVAVFVDVANIFYAAKAAGVDIDYVTLLKSASAGRDLVRAYAYTGLDPENENQRNFHSFLARHGYRVVSKDIRKYGDGKVKANLDIELVVDMMKTARNLDIAIVVSGDGDFAPAIRAVQEMGVRVEVISFRGNTSSDLIDVADQFTDITALAKVEKGSSRSGRRVAEAGDDEDLSMTEVPDKQTEGTGERRGRGGRGRGRARSPESEPAARSGRGGERPAAAMTSGGTPLVVLPGEKLSRVVGEPTEPAEDAQAEEVVESGGAVAAFEGESEAAAEDRRRRRRRGGRGRGRGRGRGEGAEGAEGAAPSLEPVHEEEEVYEPPRAPRATPFGSVWDSQLGVPTQAPAASAGGLPALGDDEDFDEPEIPEYLLAERRNRGRGQAPGGARGGRGGRGRSAYTAAMERERYGRGGGGGINRYPDVSLRERDRDRDRDRPREPRREERPARPAGREGRPPRSGEEWSEVPPELEAMLRAQLGVTPPRREERTPRPASDAAIPLDEEIETFREEPDAVTSTPEVEAEAAPRARSPRARRGRPTAEEPAAAEVVSDTAEASPPKRTTRRRSPAAESGEEGPPAKARTTRRKADAEAEVAGTPAAATRTPRRRTAKTAEAEPTAVPTESVEEEQTAAPAPARRRTTRRKAAEPAEAAAESSPDGDG